VFDDLFYYQIHASISDLLENFPGTSRCAKRGGMLGFVTAERIHSAFCFGIRYVFLTTIHEDHTAPSNYDAA
jgi:hypothetical protein